MNSNKEWLSIEPQICERGRSMRNLRKGFLAGLGMLLAFAPLAAIYAATEVTDISYASTSDGGVKIMLSTSGDEPAVSVFATENPARIVLDLADTAYTAGGDSVSVGLGAVQKYSAVGAGGRTRLVVDLSESASYDYSASMDGVILTVSGKGNMAQAKATSSSYGGGANSITGIDFRRGETGQGRVIISLDRPGVEMSVDQGNNTLFVDLYNTTLPDRLDQRLDVIDFATPVQIIDASRISNGVRISLAVTGLYEHLAYESGDSVVIEVKELGADEADEDLQLYEDKVYEGTKVTFNFQNIPVRSVLALIADVSNLNIVVADKVAGNLTLRLTNVPWDQALDIVLDARNLDMRENGNVIWIAPTEDIAKREQQLLQAQQDRRILEPLQTVLIEMSYAKASAMKNLIEAATNSTDSDYGLLSERGSVTVDERTNTLLVTDTAEHIVEIRELLTELDYAVRQVQIESRIVIASSDFAHELGVRFGVSYLHDGSNVGVVAADGSVADTIRRNGLGGAPGYPSRYQVNLPAANNNAATLGLSFLSSDVILDLELSALETEGDGEVISTPRVVTANQTLAYIRQGVQIPYENSTSSGATAVQFKNAVLELKVKPLITPDNRIQLDLDIKQDTVGEIYQTARGGSVPSIDTRALSTQVLVANGDTVVLGGIFQDEKNSTESKVPWLGDIPVVGALFRRRAHETKKRELLIFVTPSIVEDRPVL
jgi:type IV pilus assembly protein PilQ